MVDKRRASADLREFSTLATSIAEIENPESAIAAIAQAAQEFIGHRLFTAMKFNPVAMEVQRVYSSNHESYPPGGRKPKRDTEWGRLVLLQGQPYIGRNADDIRTHFNDHVILLGLGLESILNIPVRSCGKTIGTMNLMNVASYFTGDDLIPGQLLAALMVWPLSEMS
jgi:GAF domain-containing protein